MNSHQVKATDFDKVYNGYHEFLKGDLIFLFC